jgi:adenine-specific DNA-methyltransferase
MQSRKRGGSAKAAGKESRTTRGALKANGKLSTGARGRKAGSSAMARTVKQYDHPTKSRLNNPPVGLVTPETDPDLAPRTYAYDPHLDPQLIWAGKAEKSALTVDTVSLHVHERIDPFTIMEAVRTRESFIEQPSLFAQPSENPPLREALDFYKHQHGWSNRLIAGDSLLVMNSLLEREGMAGKVQMVYVDPPYGIKYRSNFQPFINRRDVQDGKDEDLTQEPEMIRAFRDTWELGIHSYLTYLRDRLLLAHQLLSDEGSLFIQISDENIHLVRCVCDDIFKADNFVCVINFVTANAQTGKLIENNCNYIIWYAKSKAKAKSRPLFLPKGDLQGGLGAYRFVETSDGQRRPMTRDEVRGVKPLPSDSRIFRASVLTSSRPGGSFSVEFDGKPWTPRKGYWSTSESGMQSLKKANRIISLGDSLYYVRYIDDFPAFPIGAQWNDTMQFGTDKTYVVQTSPKVIQRCMVMTTDPGDLVLDPTCGSGTTAVVAELWGRRWITCDTSRVALTLAKQRLMTATYDYYALANPQDGVDGGFVYTMIKHVTLKSVANNEPEPKEPLYDQPVANRDKVRVTGPFTVEAVPAPLTTDLASTRSKDADETISRSGATLRESDWRNELLKSGVRGLSGNFIKFSRVEPLAATTFIQAEAETIEEKPVRVAISFGPDYAPLEQRQVQGAWKEAQMLNPSPSILLFAAFQFDPEAAKDIDEMDPRLTKMTFLKVQMNVDLLTSDLKKKRATNEGFWLIGRPDVELKAVTSGEEKGKYLVEIHGFDYYDVRTGNIESGNTDRVAMWMLDTDYDERSLFPRQVFFPMAGEKDGWAKVARSLKAEIDEELIEAYHGTVSLPFQPGKNKRVAVKIVDDRGVESMRVVRIP